MKTPTLDDLDRDELLQLVRSHCFLRPRDLVWAQWEVATARAQAAREEAGRMFDRIRPAAEELDAALIVARTVQGPIKKVEAASANLRAAIAAHETLRAAQDKIFAKAERLARRADRLYALHEELSR